MSSARAREVSWRVLFQMLTVGAATVLVKVAAAAKVVVTARAFGTSNGLDAYLIAFLLPVFVGDTLAGGLTSSLIPTFIEVQKVRGREAAERLYRSVMAAGLGLLMVAAALTGMIAPWLFRILGSSFDAQKLTLTVSLFWVMLPCLPIGAVATCYRAILNTEERFAVPSLLWGITPVISIALLIAFGRTWGVYTLALGTLIGAVTEAAFLAVAMKRRGYSIVPRWFGREPAVEQVAKQYGPIVGSVLMLGGAPLIDQSVASMLGPGSVAALNYGTRVTVVLIAVGPSAVATAILPHFSRLTVTEDPKNIRHSLRSYMAIVLAVTLPVVIGMMVLSEPIVRLLFQRGEFTAEATHVVARIQRFSLLQIPTAMVMALVLRFISSIKANRVLLPVAGACAALNVALDYVLARSIGIAGIPLAAAGVQLAAMLYLLHVIRGYSPAVPQAVESAADLTG
jgi:putative peptidoglycan lipid II flippase